MKESLPFGGLFGGLLSLFCGQGCMPGSTGSLSSTCEEHDNFQLEGPAYVHSPLTRLENDPKGNFPSIFFIFFEGPVPGFVSLVPGFVSWVLGFVSWVLGFVFWVSGIVSWVLGIVFCVSALVFWLSGIVFWASEIVTSPKGAKTVIFSNIFSGLVGRFGNGGRY